MHLLQPQLARQCLVVVVRKQLLWLTGRRLLETFMLIGDRGKGGFAYGHHCGSVQVRLAVVQMKGCSALVKVSLFLEPVDTDEKLCKLTLLCIKVCIGCVLVR